MLEEQWRSRTQTCDQISEAPCGPSCSNSDSGFMVYLCNISCLGSDLTFLQLHSFMLFYLLHPPCVNPTFTWGRHTLIDEHRDEAGAVLNCCPAGTKKKSRIRRNLRLNIKIYTIQTSPQGHETASRVLKSGECGAPQNGRKRMVGRGVAHHCRFLTWWEQVKGWGLAGYHGSELSVPAGLVHGMPIM